MVYVSLYRRYRPQSFAEVVGQPHVTQTLVNAIAEDRLHHAYLFTGPRGTGKTSTARILAKAVNCQRGPTPEPDQTCEVCVAITDGSSVDVIELDMASHGGVDDARELRERALFAPVQGRKKVYILDEVHMASTAAFNALLKLIEEPPPHVMFAMATTDPQKVLPTILSRVQRLDLRRVGAEEVAAHVRRVVSLEGASISDDAVEAVVRAGDGSLRDTLSILEQVLSFGSGEVTGEHVAQVLGHTPVERTVEAVDLIAARDVAGLLSLVHGLLDEGHDPRRFTLDLAAHLRDLLVLQVAPDRPDLVNATAERRARLQAQSAVLPRETLIRAIDLLAATLVEQRRGPARLPLELVLAKVALPETAGDVGALADRVARLEPGGAVDVGRAAAPADLQPQDPTEAAPQPSTAAPDEGALDDGGPDGTAPDGATADHEEAIDREAEEDLTLDTIVARWQQILDALNARSKVTHGYYRAGTPVGLEEGHLVLAFSAEFHAEQATDPANLEVFQEALGSVLGRRLRVRPEVGTGTGARPPSVREASREEVDVREAESGPRSDPTEQAEALLRDELGAEPVDH